nr:hypothetical protein [Tanacetum cinerariifolium]
IHYCLKNPPYNYTWADKTIPVSEGSTKTTTKRFVTLVKQSQELKTVSYDKLYDILKQHQNEVNEIRAERARTANPLVLVAQQQQVYHPQNHHTHYTQNSSARSQQTATRNRGKEIVNSPPPIYDQEPFMVIEDDEMSKDKEIDKLMALISLSFKKIYKPTNNNLRTSSITSRANQDNSPRVSKGIGYDNQRICNVVVARETVGTTMVQKSRIQCYNCKEFRHVTRECQKPKREKDAAITRKRYYCKHIIYVADNSGPIFDSEPLQKIDQDDDDDLASERDLLASLIEKLKCEIDDSKNRNKFLETSNKDLVDKLKETNELMYKDLKKFQAELDRRNDVKYASKINDLNQMILDMKNELFAHQETISILSQQKEAQIKFHKTREDKELDKVIALENKVKVLDNIVYKTGQSVQIMNMLNHNCKTSFAKLVFLKKAQRANPRLYDI